ncbi:MAG: hypothetical protein WC838_07790, partial [Candidatus Margulisiibacteriota bacterium]
LIDAVLRRTGLKIDVFTVGDVVYYIDSYLSHKLAAHYPIHSKDLLIAEVGSGSLDVSVMEKGFPLFNLGLPIGALRIKQLFSKLDGSLEDNLEAVQENIENEFSSLVRLVQDRKIDDVIIVDENYSPYLSNLLPGRDPGSKFYKLNQNEIQKALTAVSRLNNEEISAKYKLPMEIAESIHTYLNILNNFFAFIKNKYLYVLETSLAEAVLGHLLLSSKLGTKYDRIGQHIAVAKYICEKYQGDPAHAQNVTDSAKALFDALKEELGLRDEEYLYLMLASYLHDIGSFIHNRLHHKHTEYIISSLSLFRLTEEEIRVIACIARYHRRGTPSDTHPIYNSLSPNNKILVQKLSALLRIANALDSAHRQKTRDLKVKLSANGSISLTVKTHSNFLLEKNEFGKKKDMLEEITGKPISLIIKE